MRTGTSMRRASGLASGIARYQLSIAPSAPSSDHA
jgi:hypothetical protein